MFICHFYDIFNKGALFSNNPALLTNKRPLSFNNRGLLQNSLLRQKISP